MRGCASQPLVAFSTKQGSQKMNAAAHRVEGNANTPVLYIALKSSATTLNPASRLVNCVGADYVCWRTDNGMHSL